MSDEQTDYSGLHRRFDKLEANFDEVKKEQHQMASDLSTVNHRIDLIEVQIDAAQRRETLVIGSLNEKLEANANLIKRLFDKFDAHIEGEVDDRKKLLFWLVSCVVSVLGTAAVIVFTRLFGG